MPSVPKPSIYPQPHHDYRDDGGGGDEQQAANQQPSLAAFVACLLVFEEGFTMGEKSVSWCDTTS